MKEKIKSSQKYLIYFILYAMIGWIYEVFLEVVVYKWGFSNRGVLFGPYCPVYGFGALAFIFTIYPLIKNKKGWKKYALIPLVFIGCMVIATLIELITSYLCEFAMGSWPWQTYATSYPGTNFQGRIALSPSIRFGLGGTVFLYFLQPLFENFTDNQDEKRTKIISITIACILVIDMIYSFIIK